MLVAEGKADIFLTYCTNALAARNENPKLRIVQGARPEAERLAEFILSPAARAILAKHGFAAGDTP